MSLTAELIHSYGYPALAAGVGFESVGIPLPGETVLIVAAVCAGSTHRLSTVLVVVVAAIAAIVGDNLGFWIGRRFGAEVLDWLPHRRGRWVDRLRRVEGIVDRHGSAIVVLGRFVSLLRTYVAFLSGHSAMRWRRFAVLNSLGCILWASVVGGAAAALGSDASGLFALITGVLLLSLVGGFLLHHHYRGHRGRPTSNQELPMKQGAEV